MNTKKEIINCPNCGKNNTWISSNDFRPFCSERCKLIDLGDWASEKYRIPTKPDSSEEDLPQQNEDDDNK